MNKDLPKEVLSMENLSHWDEESLFNILRKSKDLDDAAFKALVRECLCRIFYSDDDYLEYFKYK